MRLLHMSRASVALVALVGLTSMADAQVPANPGGESGNLGLAALRSSSSSSSSGWHHHSPHRGVMVDDDGLQCRHAAYTTIQDAVDAGAGKIQVCAGTYPENVLIPAGAKITLEGYGHGEARVTGVAGSAGPIIDVEAGSNVTIRKLTVDGESALAGGTVVGIRYTEASGTVERVKVLNIRNASGSSQGSGIQVLSTGPKAKLTVTKSRVENYTRSGIIGNGDGADIRVTYNTVIGPVLPRVWAPNGIQVSRDAKGQVTRNKVDSNISPNPNGGAGSGILAFCPGRTTIQSNTVTGGDLGISIADTAKARVQSNNVSRTNFEAISLQLLGDYFGDLGCTPPVSPVEDNTVSSNYAHDNLLDGISFSNFDGSGTATGSPNNNLISYNKIRDNGGDGIHVYTGTDNRFYRNRVSGSGSGTNAVDDSLGGGTAGTANTWIANNCQPGMPAGICAF
jgi:parallel beta-helix repeat protein